MTALLAYTLELVDDLVAWCASNAAVDPLGITCTGLALAVGLNERQIRVTRLASAAPTPAISYPQALRERDFQTRPWRTVTLDSPDWLTQATEALIAAGATAEGQLLIRSRSVLDLPASAEHIRKQVERATLAATGRKLTASKLARTRIPEADAAGMQMSVFATGYAPSYAIRLLNARRRPLLPAPPR